MKAIKTRVPSFAWLYVVVCTLVVGLGVGGCDESVAPDPPAVIAIVSGDLQTSLRGTELPKPLIVKVTTETGAVPELATVLFSVVQGEGTVSSSRVRVSSDGLASTRLTLGAALGTVIIRAAIEENTAKLVLFQVTSSNFYCPEAEDTLRIHYGGAGTLFLATPKSGLFSPIPGLVEVHPSTPSVTPFVGLPPDGYITQVVYDLAFSPRGDLYLARGIIFPVIVKVGTDRSVEVFSSLDDISEITMNPLGLLVGCDARGPFAVGCRDTLLRFSEASYSGGVNNNAVAVDPRRDSVDKLGEDIYFIYEPDSTLRRLPMDSLRVDGALEEDFAQLTEDEAASARGMVCDDDGTVYILVDSDNTKALLRVLPDGTKSVLFDFFSRGAGDAAGNQRDLALDPAAHVLYTLDVLNDNLLAYPLTGAPGLVEKFPSPTSDLSTAGSTLERVGLDVSK